MFQGRGRCVAGAMLLLMFHVGLRYLLRKGPLGYHRVLEIVLGCIGYVLTGPFGRANYDNETSAFSYAKYWVFRGDNEVFKDFLYG